MAGIVATARQARIAESERARAERRFGDVRKLANSFVFEFHDAIEDLPGATPARQLVVKKGLEYLDGLAAGGRAAIPSSSSSSPAPTRRSATSRATPSAPTWATPRERSRAIARRSRSARPSTPGAPPTARPRAISPPRTGRLGLLEDEAGQTVAGVAHVARAQEIVTRLAAEDPGDPAARRLLAEAGDAAGLLALKTGDHAAAERHQRGALAIWEAETQARPDDAAALRGLLRTHGALARTLRIGGRNAESADHYRRALAVAEQRLRLAPADPAARRDHSTANTNVAVALYKEGAYDRATLHAAAVAGPRRGAAARDPKNSQAQRDVAWDFGFLAELAIVQGRLVEALGYQQRGLAMDRARAQASPDSFQAEKDLAENLSAVSDLLSRHPAVRGRGLGEPGVDCALRGPPAGEPGTDPAEAAHGRPACPRGHDARSARPARRRLRSLAPQPRALDELAGGAAIDAEHVAARRDVEKKAKARCDAAVTR